LKQQLQTTITIDRLDFDTFDADEHVHVGISVKDFKAIVAHADSLRATVTATYSHATMPLQLTYSDGGMQCAFTLVTMSEYLGNPIKLAPRPHDQPIQPPQTNRPPTNAPTAQNLQMAAPTTMPAPPLPASRSFSRDLTSHTSGWASPPPPQASINQESLFLADDDEDEDDRRWGAGDYMDEGDTVRWVSTPTGQ
jgi:cell cycle checkpoint control protein RAD9A